MNMICWCVMQEKIFRMMNIFQLISILSTNFSIIKVHSTKSLSEHGILVCQIFVNICMHW